MPNRSIEEAVVAVVRGHTREAADPDAAYDRFVRDIDAAFQEWWAGEPEDRESSTRHFTKMAFNTLAKGMNK